MKDKLRGEQEGSPSFPSLVSPGTCYSRSTGRKVHQPALALFLMLAPRASTLGLSTIPGLSLLFATSKTDSTKVFVVLCHLGP